MKSMLKDAMTLFIITLVAGLALGIVYEVTKVPIANQEVKAKMEACSQVFQEADHFLEYKEFKEENANTILEDAGITKQDITEVVTAYDEKEQVLGYVITIVTHEGYSGDITFSMGITLEGKVNGISILSIAETAGLGMKANTDEFKNQWKNKTVEAFEYTKTGAVADNQIDAISGATITTNAITNGTNAGLVYFRSIAGGGTNE